MKIENEEELYNMLSTGSAPCLVKQFYEKKTNKKVNSKQIYNLNAKFKTTNTNGNLNRIVNEMAEIQKVIEAREKFDGKKNFEVIREKKFILTLNNLI